MLAKTHCERASVIQKVNSVCLLSKGVKRTVLELLNKQGICQEYKLTSRYAKNLSKFVQRSLQDFCRNKIGIIIHFAVIIKFHIAISYVSC